MRRIFTFDEGMVTGRGRTTLDARRKETVYEPRHAEEEHAFATIKLRKRVVLSRCGAVQPEPYSRVRSSGFDERSRKYREASTINH